MINVVVTGACGRMGSAIIRHLSSQRDMKLVGAVEISQHKNIDSSLEAVIDKSDVIIEFVNPKTSIRHLEIAHSFRKPIVIGTTGFDKSELKVINDFAKDIPCVLSPNMSVGVNSLFHLVSKLAKILGNDYDIEIVEAHHNLKKDAPSGTALKFAELCACPKDKIHSLRCGDIVGDHTIVFAGPGERIEITHRAHSRDVFAFGAVKAARFVVNARPGLYSMQDVMGIL